VLAGATPRQARQALAMLTETGRSYAQAQDAVRLALERDLVGLWEPAVGVAQERGGTLGGLLADALWRSGDSELARTIAHALPEETVALRDLAVVAAGAAQNACRARPPSLERDEELADLLNRLARHLAYLNRRDEALTVALDAVEISRSVARATKNSRSPQLALALTTLSQRFASSGDARRGRGASEESVSIYRRMPEPERDAVLHDYASALAMLAVQRCQRPVDVGLTRSDAGRDAVAAFDRLRGLPGDPYALERGRALTAFAYELAFFRRYDEALQASETAVADLRHVAEIRPDSALPLLAEALDSASAHRRQSGYASASVEAAEEALAILRALAVGRPEAFVPQVARALVAVASAYAENGRMPDALAALEESVATSRALYEVNPGQYRRELCGALTGLCFHALAAGDFDAGLSAGEEAVLLDAEREPGRPSAGGEISLNFAAGSLAAAGHADAAYACADHAVKVYMRLAKRRPRFAMQAVQARRIRRSIGRGARQVSGAQPSSVE
jgi:hypothetical protein